MTYLALSRHKNIGRLLAGLGLLAIAACGGGGGGGGIPTVEDFENTPDYDPCILASDNNTYCNYGLGQIGAAHAYAEGASGSGVVVAVIDSGIDTTHSELDSRISGASTDIASPGTPLDDEMGHGTMVAGIIAAERNDIGTHGVAFNAKILALRTDGRNPDGWSTWIFAIPDVTAALSYATGRSDVINLSLGVPGSTIDDTLGPDFEQALIDAMAAGAIIVAAAGNEGAAEPSLPAAYAGDLTVNASGQMVAVGAVNNAGDALADFSNQCGQAMDFCLVAPGEGIWTTIPGNDLGYVFGGTSFAAPYVSGAAALLIDLWPTLQPAEVVDIMLTTATDMGDPGVDAVYGHGLLNLRAAVLPAGPLEVPLTPLADGGGVALDGTGLSLGSAFGDALANSDLLSRTFALDDYDRNYGVDLNDVVGRPSRGFGLPALLADGAVETVNAGLPNGMKVAMGLSEEDPADAAGWAGMAADADEARELRGFSLSADGAAGAGFRVGYGITPEQQMAGLAASDAAGLFWMPGDILGPHHGLVDAGAGLSLSRPLGASTSLSLGWVEQDDDPDNPGRDARIGEIALQHRFGNGATAYAGFSNVDEQGGFLGSDAAGGFAVAGADTRFYTLGGRYPLAGGLELIGSYMRGDATIGADGSSLLGEWSGIRAEAFGVGLVKQGLLGSRDRIGLLAGQPLRASHGAATVTAPVDYLIDKTVVQETERVSLVPSGREIDLQLAYDTPLRGGGALSGWLMMQLEPGHVADADPAYGAGLRLAAEF